MCELNQLSVNDRFQTCCFNHQKVLQCSALSVEEHLFCFSVNNSAESIAYINTTNIYIYVYVCIINISKMCHELE